MRIDRTKFFSALRASPLNGGKLSQTTVDCANGILDAYEEYVPCEERKVDHLASVFGQCHHEGGNRLASIKETVYASHKDQNPSDATVAARLETAWKGGKLPWVKTPYWRKDASGKYWFGRSLIQITHQVNYARLGREIGVDLVGNPDLALVPAIAAKIAVVGMVKGLFTGAKLADARTGQDYRKIVNGDYRDAGLIRKLDNLYAEYAKIIRGSVE